MTYNQQSINHTFIESIASINNTRFTKSWLANFIQLHLIQHKISCQNTSFHNNRQRSIFQHSFCSINFLQCSATLSIMPPDSHLHFIQFILTNFQKHYLFRIIIFSKYPTYYNHTDHVIHHQTPSNEQIPIQHHHPWQHYHRTIHQISWDTNNKFSKYPFLIIIFSNIIFIKWTRDSDNIRIITKPELISSPTNHLISPKYISSK